MGASVTTIIEQLVGLFFFMGCGFLLRKKNWVDPSFGGALSKVEMWFLIPLMLLQLLTRQFTVANLKENSTVFLISTVATVLSYLFALLASRLFGREQATRDVYIFGFTFPNVGYLGLPLVGAVLPEMLPLYSVMVIPVNIGIYSIGEYTMRTDKRINWKSLCNPILIGIALGIVLGLCGVQLPSAVDTVCTKANACVGPVAMLIAGFVFGGCDMKKIFRKVPPYFGTLVRMVVMPFAAMGLCRLFGADPVHGVLTAVMIGLPVGMNVVIFPTMHGGDAESGAQFCFMSHLISLVTLPLILAVAGMVWSF